MSFFARSAAVALFVAISANVGSSQTILRVDIAANGNIQNADGLTWTNAFRSPHAALFVMQNTHIPQGDCDGLGGCQIWIADGTYEAPASGSFDMLNKVAIYGGFHGEEVGVPGETFLGQRDVAGNQPAILDGERSDGTYAMRVVRAVNLDQTAVLDGVTVRNGLNHHQAAFGAGIFVDGGNPVFVDVTVTQNFAHKGGGMSIVDNATPVFRECRFIANASESGAAAVIIEDSQPRFTNCEFSHNTVTEEETRGGAIINLNSDTYFGYCIFIGNRVDFMGGAIYFEDSDPEIEHCTFAKNIAGDYGGGSWNQSACGGAITMAGACEATILHSMFENNQAGYGGAYCTTATFGSPNPSHSLISDSTFVSNIAVWGGGGGLFLGHEFLNNGMSHDVVDSKFIGNESSRQGGAGAYVYHSTANFVNATFSGNYTFGPGGGVRVQHDDTHFANCVFTGNHAEMHGGAIMVDLASFSNSYVGIRNCTIASNLSEQQSGGIRGDFATHVFNSIIWGNIDEASSTGIEEEQVHYDTGSVSYSCIQGQSLWTDNNIGEDPQFTDLDGVDNELGTEYDDPRVADSSPVIDAGNNADVGQDLADINDNGLTTDELPYDLHRNTRIVDSRAPFDGATVDMGAVELQFQCTEPADCCDNNGDGARDNACDWCSCEPSEDGDACVVEQRLFYADVGGSFGACPLDGFCNIHDRMHVLMCFGGQNSCTNAEFNADVGGSFGDCTPDGFCNIHDANHVTNCFAGTSACQSACGGFNDPGQDPVHNIPFVATASVDLQARSARASAGSVFSVDVFVNATDQEISMIQVSVDVSGGDKGALSLVDFTDQHPRQKQIFSNRIQEEKFTAGNLLNGQFLIGVDNGGAMINGRIYLGTLVFQSTEDAAGMFTIALANERHANKETAIYANANEAVLVDLGSSATVSISPRQPTRRAQPVQSQRTMQSR